MITVSRRISLCLFACLLLLVPCSVLAQSSTSAAVSRIRAWYNEIEKQQAQYKRTILPLEGRSTEGGELTLYHEGNTLRKMRAQDFGELGQTTQEFFFRQGRLFFYYRVKTDYDGILGKPKSRTEERVYFDQDKIIRWLSKGNKAQSITGAVARQRQRDILEEAATLTKVARSKSSSAK